MLNFWGTYTFMAISLIITVSMAVGGLHLVRRYHNHELLAMHHSVAGPFLSIIATLYAVVLGFIVVDALNTFQHARGIVETEANAYHDVFHLARGLSEPTSTDIRKLCIEYCDAMVQFEWPAMSDGKGSDQGHIAFSRLWHDVCTYQPKTAAETTFLAAMIDELRTAGDARHSRLLSAQPLYDPAIWIVLGVGAVVTIVFTYFFGVENFRIQALMTALVTVVVTLNLVVVGLFDSPFSGDVRVAPIPFQSDLINFRSEVQEH